MHRSNASHRRLTRSAVHWSLALVASAAVVGTAAAAEYKSVGEPAILYDAPTLRGSRLGIAPRGMPLEIIVAQGDWVRVRDSQGGLSWVERKGLVDKRTVVATDSVPAEVRSAPDDGAPSVFRAQAGILLDLVSPPSAGWCGVRHRDGQSGFVRVGSVWGE